MYLYYTLRSYKGYWGLKGLYYKVHVVLITYWYSPSLFILVPLLIRESSLLGFLEWLLWQHGGVIWAWHYRCLMSVLHITLELLTRVIPSLNQAHLVYISEVRYSSWYFDWQTGLKSMHCVNSSAQGSCFHKLKIVHSLFTKWMAIFKSIFSTSLDFDESRYIKKFVKKVFVQES